MLLGVALVIEKIHRCFLWGDERSKRTIHAVKWEEVCKSKSSGGLGIGRGLIKNNGMLAKWIWRFGRERDALWRRVLVENYGIQDMCLSWSWKKSSKDSFFVKAVCSLFKAGSLTAKIILEGFSTVVGKGDRAEFWTEF
ncbi:hypothetical protein Ddye_032176 [Dipteronia dyeriana]|uniref:Uncharacterized protein n=1 Tax=Dipteronia dyeriana TaxID=168575 RepID=A0AAD9TKP5_9ROSI|nr:hypothetical protein Ddye_032176 [Dipteronia dyeriana]